MDSLLGWLSGLSVETLYALIFVASLVEGIIPLMPGDIAAALLAFFAARSGGAFVPTVLMVTLGSVLGAIVMWWIGRRFGADWLAHKLGKFGFGKLEHRLEEAEVRVEAAFRRYGWVALF